LIESQRWLWNHEARARFGTMSRASLAQFALRWQLPPAESREQLVEGMKTLPLLRRQELEQALRELTLDFEPSPQQHAACDIMSWDQARSMSRELITIGSHTVGHPILPTLAPHQLRFELAESRRWLEDRLGREVKHFCYPNGAFNSAVVEQTRQVYTAAVTTEHEFATITSSRYSLPRISSAETLPLLAWRLHRPGA
jgi:peptidoglycan/xylan/chitin deacetylase (PgdA/CDA1 family)